MEWINELEATIKKGSMVPPRADELHVCTEVLRKDLLQKLTEGEKAIVWRYREAQPVAYTYWLHALLSVVNWSEHDQVLELHRVLKTYPRDFELHKHQVISPLMLLTVACPDADVRQYAVECLRKMELSSHQMRFWMPEFVQSLKSEILHWSCSPLLRYLQSNIETLPAALALFWQLKVETRSPHYKRMEAILNEVRKGFSEPDILDEQERLWGEQGVFANISRACYKLAKGVSATGEVKIFSGSLRKRALKSGRKWAKRDFVLYPGKLCYYKDVMHNKAATGA